MTPEQARQLLDGTTPAPWEVESWNKQEVGCPEVTDFWTTSHNDKQVAAQETIERHFDETESDFNLIAAAPDMAKTIAGMTTEYSVQLADGELVGAGWGTHETAWCDCDAWQRDGYNARIVCRYVTAPQPLGETK
ncbi:hypothetical protein [uncultured Corynebacterium sp.]|uniref:hypothetical protein n=1 Tax=uncultured Corynebacterium sp. TaxID=159447 RepID=UPI002597906A|nr:hypothetical protein [uncultured Corynebacterium sp.]